MSLERALMASFFGPDNAPPSIDVALALDGDEISDTGYRRQGVTKGRWRMTSATARTSVSFGPFAAAVRFDQVWLMRDQELLDSFALDDVVSLVKGTVWEHDITVSLDG